MMNISSSIIYLLSGGIALLVLKEVFKFMKWWAERYGWLSKPTQSTIVNKADREVLELIHTKISSTSSCLTALHLDFVRYKTKFEFLVQSVRTQNGSLASVTKAMTELSAKFSTTTAVCDKRFEAVEEKIARQENEK